MEEDIWKNWKSHYIPGGYACLFEYMKKEGIESVLNFARDIFLLSENRNIIINAYCHTYNAMNKASINNHGNHEISFSQFENKHKDIIKYLKEHSDEMVDLDITDESFLKIINEVGKSLNAVPEKSHMLEIYAENARLLDNLRIRYINYLSLEKNFYLFNIKRLSSTDNAYVFDFRTTEEDYPKLYHSNYRLLDKCFTDGNTSVFEATSFRNYFDSSSVVKRIKKSFSSRFPDKSGIIGSTKILIESPKFIICSLNRPSKLEQRIAFIKDFGFDGNKLPTEEEIREEIPRKLVKMIKTNSDED